MKQARFTKQFTASFTTESYGRIKQLTDREGISMGEWMRMAADEKLGRRNDQDILEGENDHDQIGSCAILP